MPVGAAEIMTILSVIRSGMEWAQKQRDLGNITQADYEELFENIEIKKAAWDDLAPDDDE